MPKRDKHNPPFTYEQHKMTQAFGDLRFRFIPCGYKPIDQDTMVYVKYKPIAKQSFDHSYSVLDTGANYVHFDFPDRELLFTNQSFAIGGDRPFNKPASGDNWHTGVPLTIASSAGDDLPFDRIMINPHAFNSERVEFKIRKKGVKYTSDKVVLSDCLVAGSLLVTNKGIVKIEDFVGEISNKVEYEGNTKVTTPSGKLELPSHVFKSSNKRPVYVTRLAKGQTLHSTGGELVMTKNGWKRVDELTRNDEVRIAFGANVWSKNDVVFNYTQKIYIEDRFSEYPDSIECHICGQEYQQIDSHLSFKHNICVSDVRDIYPYTKSKAIAAKHSTKKLIDRKQVFPTKMTPELAELLGLIVADGSIRKNSTSAMIRLYFGDKIDCAKRAKKLWKNIFGTKLRVRKSYTNDMTPSNSVTPTPGKIYYTLYTEDSQLLLGFFEHIGLKAVNTKYKEIPWSVLQSTKACVIAFLNGLYSADGCVSKGGMPSIYTASKNLARQLVTVLNNLGIPTNARHIRDIKFPTKTGSELRKGYGCSISCNGRTAGVIFNNLIKLNNTKKRKLQKLHTTTTKNHNNLENQGKIVYVTPTSGYLFSRVVSRTLQNKSETVYDISLADNKHAYITDYGIHVHNSGGFQLGHGAIDFINPQNLSEFYIRNADEGVVLDVPARSLGDHDILKHTARIQNLNVKYMKSILPKDFRLATVAHGLALDRMDKFRQDIEDFDADFPIMCIASTLRFNLLEAIHRILHIIMNGAEYQQYHVLGISNPPLIAALIKMAYVLKQKGIDVLITSDSSSPISFSLKHTYYNQRAFYDGLNPTRVGTKMSSNKDNPIAKYANPHRRLNSTDPLTQIIGGYQDIVSAYPVTVTYEYMIYMNQLELARYCNQMCLTANDTTCKEYKELVNEQYKASIHRHLLAITMDYLNVFLEYDLKTAYNKYKFYMPFFSGEHTLSSLPSLIESASEAEKEAEFSVKKKHFVKVLKNYYNFHKKGIVPDKISTNKRMKTGRSLVVKI